MTELGKRLAELAALSATERECYEAGFDSVVSGASMKNCHFKFFGTPAKTKAWERGAADAKQSRRPK